MVTERKKHPLAAQTLKARCEFNLADGEGVAEVKGAIHVGIGKSAKPFGVIFLNLRDWVFLLVKVGIGVDTLRQRRSVRVEMLGLSPRLTDVALNVDEKVALVGLCGFST